MRRPSRRIHARPSPTSLTSGEGNPATSTMLESVTTTSWITTLSTAIGVAVLRQHRLAVELPDPRVPSTRPSPRRWRGRTPPTPTSAVCSGRAPPRRIGRRGPARRSRPRTAWRSRRASWSRRRGCAEQTSTRLGRMPSFADVSVKDTTPAFVQGAVDLGIGAGVREERLVRVLDEGSSGRSSGRSGRARPFAASWHWKSAANRVMLPSTGSS